MSEGDLILHHAELVQTISHAPGSLLVDDKPTVMLVEVENTFTDPVEAFIEVAVEQPGASLPTYSTLVTLPAECRKRFYLPYPVGADDPSCEVSPTGATLAEVSMQPLLDAGPVTTLVSLTPREALSEENDDNNVHPRPGLDSPARGVVPTSLRVAYVRVFCPKGAPCKTDPGNYGDVSDPEYTEAIRWGNAHTRALYPVGPIGFSGAACRFADGSPCEIPGRSDKCVFFPCAHDPSESCGDCAGVVDDARESFRLASAIDPFVDRAVAFVPGGYYGYHGIQSGGDYVGGYAPPALRGVTVKSASEGGIDFPGVHVPTVPHELGHTYGLEHPVGPSTPPAGYWVECDDVLGSASAFCEVPEPPFDILGARDLMAPVTAGFLEPTRRWINADNYEDLLAQLKLDPDPTVLYLDGTVTRDAQIVTRNVQITVEYMSERETGKIDGHRGSTKPELFTIVSLDASGGVVGTHLLKGSWTQHFEHRGVVHLTSMGFTERIAFPADTAKLRFTLGGVTLLEIDPLSRLLRMAVERIPDKGFERNPAERRKALLAKVDAIEKQIATGARKGAVEKLRSDLRNVADKWLVEFSQRNPVEETTRQDLFRVIDSLISRLEHQLASSPGPTPVPTGP